jgi:hypothetical protein
MIGRSAADRSASEAQYCARGRDLAAASTTMAAISTARVSSIWL